YVCLSGPTSQCPAAPCGAAASTIPLACRLSLPLVSTDPPSPPSAPPRAKIEPANLEVCSDHTIAVPPSPALRAETSILVPASIVTVVADAIGGSAPQRAT